MLYSGLNFGLDMDSRVAIVGPNGAGKSTFLKLVMGEIIPSKARARAQPHLYAVTQPPHVLEPDYPSSLPNPSKTI